MSPSPLARVLAEACSLVAEATCLQPASWSPWRHSIPYVTQGSRPSLGEKQSRASQAWAGKKTEHSYSSDTAVFCQPESCCCPASNKQENTNLRSEPSGDHPPVPPPQCHTLHTPEEPPGSRTPHSKWQRLMCEGLARGLLCPSRAAQALLCLAAAVSSRSWKSSCPCPAASNSIQIQQATDRHSRAPCGLLPSGAHFYWRTAAHLH